MCVISFIIIIIILKTQGHPTMIPPKCIENTFKAVQSTFACILNSAYINLVRRAKSEANDYSLLILNMKYIV